MGSFNDVSCGLADAEWPLIAGEVARTGFDVQTEGGRSSPSEEPRLLRANGNDVTSIMARTGE